MIEELLNYYKRNITTYSLVFKNMKSLYNFSTYLLILSLISGYLTIITVPLIFIGITFFYYAMTMFAIVLGLSILVVSILNSKAKRILRTRYAIDVKKGIWRTVEFDSMQSQILINYLKTKGLYSIDKIEMIIRILEKEMDRSKEPSFLAPGIFLALFIPVWSQFAIFLFKSLEGKNINEASLLVSTLILIILFIAVCVGTFKKMLHLAQDFFMVEVNIKKKFLVKIEDIMIIYSEDDNEKQSSLLIKRSRSN